MSCNVQLYNMVVAGVHNDNEEKEEKGRSAKRLRKRLIKISSFSHGSRVTKIKTRAPCTYNMELTS